MFGPVMLSKSRKKGREFMGKGQEFRWNQSKNAAGILKITIDGT